MEEESDLVKITEAREKRFKDVISNRQMDLTIVLENVHDPHNIGAVLRSCDAVGISEVFIIYSEESTNFEEQHIGKNSSSGAKKWVKAHFYNDLEDCFRVVRSKYKKIYGTHLSSESVSLYDLDMSDSIALVFGNEKDGISAEARKLLDGNFIIPQYGMVQSLNISVACAVTLFEASRQRKSKDMYTGNFDLNNAVHTELYNEFLESHFNRSKG